MKKPTKKQQQALIDNLTIQARTDALQAIAKHLAAKKSIEVCGVFAFTINKIVTTTINSRLGKKVRLKSKATETALVGLSCVTSPQTRFGQVHATLNNEGTLEAHLEYALTASILRASDAAGVIEEDMREHIALPVFAEQFLQQPVKELGKKLSKALGKEANEIAQGINSNLPKLAFTVAFVREKYEDDIESDYPLLKLRIGWK